MYISIYRLTDEESKENWKNHGNPDGPIGKNQSSLL